MAVLFVIFAMKEKETARLEARGVRRRKGREAMGTVLLTAAWLP